MKKQALFAGLILMASSLLSGPAMSEVVPGTT